VQVAHLSWSHWMTVPSELMKYPSKALVQESNPSQIAHPVTHNAAFWVSGSTKYPSVVL